MTHRLPPDRSRRWAGFVLTAAASLLQWAILAMIFFGVAAAIVIGGAAR